MKIYSNGGMLQVPSCGAFDVYSTEEQVVGRWIDGKPIYKITVLGNLNNGSGEVHTKIPVDNLSELDRLIDVSAVLRYGAINTIFPYSADGIYAIYSLYVGGINFWHNDTSFNNGRFSLTAFYTKTTDQATIELPATLAVSQPLYTVAPQSAAQAELTAEIENEEV